MSDSPPSSTSRAPRGRLAITLALPLALLFMPPIGLPGVDTSGLPAATGRNLDVFALGVTPFISASMIVELCALSSRSWRALRHGGPAGRAKLGRATLILAAVLALAQAFGITSLLQHLPLSTTSGFSVPVILLTMTAGSFLLALASHLAGVYGLAGGIAVLSVTSAFHGLRYRLGTTTTTDLAAFAVFAAAVALTTAHVLRAAKARPETAAEPTYREAPERKTRSSIQIPTPASGIMPLLFSASLLSLPATLGLRTHMAALSATAIRGASLVTITLLTIFFAWAFNAPARIGVLGARAAEGTPAAEVAAEARAGLRAAALRSLAFLVVLFAVGELAGSFSGALIGAGAIALATGMALDIAAEWRARRAIPDLVPVWPEHRPHAIPIAREALDVAGIAVHARGEHLRRLLQFFGPYAPIDLMVARADEAQAVKILTSLLLARPKDEALYANKPAPAPKARWTRLETSLAGAIVLVGAGTMILPDAVSPLPQKSYAPLRPSSLEVLAVDDDADPFEPAPEDLPRGVSLVVETVNLGTRGASYRQGVRRYARIVKLDGESLAEARARLVTWAETHLDPHGGGRVLAEPIVEAEEGSDVAEQVGFRTYVVKGERVVDGSHIRSVHAQMDGAETALPRWSVRVELSPDGAERFRAFTAANVRRRAAIVVDGVVRSAPMIMSEIPGGVMMISVGAGAPEVQAREAERLEKQLLGR
ncbi:Preprotein translocase secY subunit [Minicystis rosea]|nr:Preprotein translocase secY subunit [Minicystis rosea]